MKSMGERLEAFAKMLQPDIEATEKYYAELEIGTKFWSPCSGNSAIGNERNHTGLIETYAGKGQFSNGGEWISEEQARTQGINISHSHGLCAECKKDR
jgi:hypothetical protein